MVAQPQSQETSWLPRDGILLKNAVEAGASLESLAKGAENFSQRFTVEEVQDRWNGLLYDPLVSAETSARMTEVEHSKENECFYEKRKFDSVRQQYYALHKRICNEPLDSLENGIVAPDLGFSDEDISIDQNGIENIIPHSFEEKTALMKNCSVVEEVGQFKKVCSNLDGGEVLQSIADKTQTGEADGYSGFRGGKVFNLTIPDRGASFHSHGYSSAPLDSPLWNAIEGLSTPTLPDIGTCDGYVNVTSDLGYNAGLSEVKPENQLLCDDMKNSGSSTEYYLAELSKSLFDFSNEEEEIHLMGSDGNIIDKSYIEGFNLLLLDSPSHNGMLNALVPSVDCPNISDSTCGAEVIGHPDGQERPSALKPEYRKGVICCVLNTVDPYVPFNDDVFLLG